MEFALTIAETTLLFMPAIAGTYVSFVCLRFPDLSVESSWALGAMATAWLIQWQQLSVGLALVPAFLFGAAAGLLLFLIHRVNGNHKLLAGLIAYFAVNALNFRIAYPSAQINLADTALYTSLFDKIGSLAPVAVAAITVVALWERSILGIRARMIGETAGRVADTFSFNKAAVYCVSLVLAGGLAALGGASFAVHAGVALPNYGVGILIKALFGALAGSQLCAVIAVPPRHRYWSIPLGALALGFVVVVADRAGLYLQNTLGHNVMRASDVDALVAVLLLILLFFRREQSRTKGGSEW